MEEEEEIAQVASTLARANESRSLIAYNMVEVMKRYVDREKVPLWSAPGANSTQLALPIPCRLPKNAKTYYVLCPYRVTQLCTKSYI